MESRIESKMERNKAKFKQIVFEYLANKEGVKELMDWLENETDFYTAPASTKFHGNYKGGLVEHSINVYYSLINYAHLFKAEDVGYWEQMPESSLIITALFHDLCKANFYKPDTRNVKNNGKWEQVDCFSIDDQFPYGHGEKSVYLLNKFIKLTDEEALAIRWHMGAYDNAVKGGDYSLSKVYDTNPLAFALHQADEFASHVLHV